MKTIKFFSFALLVALAWVSCKNTGAETTTEATGISADSLATLKTAKLGDLNSTITMLSQKVTELEAAMATATDDMTNQNLATQLEAYKTSLATIQGMVPKVNEATAETWATVAAELESTFTNVKMAIAGVRDSNSNAIGGTATENK